MEKISSKTNPKVCYAQKLKQKKYREQEQKVLLESKKVIWEAEKAGLKLEYLFCTEQNLNDAKDFTAENVFVVTDEICKILSSTVTSQNMFAVACISPKKSAYQDKVLVLDGLQNPDNLGAIVRNAVATNFIDIFAINSVDIYNEKTIRSSMGNVFKVNFIKTDYQQLKTLLNGYQILTADMDGEDVFKIKNFSKKVALVIGNEGNGVSDEILALTTKKIAIPMQNQVESLNASVSAGIIMYQIITKQGE